MSDLKFKKDAEPMGISEDFFYMISDGGWWKPENFLEEDDAIEFAKIHVQAALKEASENAMGAHCTDYIDKDSILNSYSLDNIK